MRFFALPIAALLLLGCTAPDGDTRADSEAIRVVGSSTVFPFAARVAEEQRRLTGQRMVVEATGSGGGHKLFCMGPRSERVAPPPDIVTSSRLRTANEAALCEDNGIADSLAIPIGKDGIVLAQSLDAEPLGLDLTSLFLALALRIPTSDTDCTLIDNPHRTWADINTVFPNIPIVVHGPPPTSGTRDSFIEQALQRGAAAHPCLSAMTKQDPALLNALTGSLRRDGAWVDEGENDGFLVQTLARAPGEIAVFGYGTLSGNRHRLRAIPLNGIEPNAATIADGRYPISRPLLIYVRRGQLAVRPELARYIDNFLAETASGEEGYLKAMGLVPLPAADRAAARAALKEARP